MSKKKNAKQKKHEEKGVSAQDSAPKPPVQTNHKKKETPASPVFRGVLSLLISSVLLTFLCVNIWASQQIDPLYSKLVREEPEAEYEFFSIARKLPVFTEIYPSMDGTFEQYRTRLEVQDNKRKEQIAQFETYLEQNPKSRDIFLIIASLYEQEGNLDAASEYYQKAREIDPSLPQQ